MKAVKETSEESGIWGLIKTMNSWWEKDSSELTKKTWNTLDNTFRVLWLKDKVSYLYLLEKSKKHGYTIKLDTIVWHGKRSLVARSPRSSSSPFLLGKDCIALFIMSVILHCYWTFFDIRKQLAFIFAMLVNSKEKTWFGRDFLLCDGRWKGLFLKAIK